MQDSLETIADMDLRQDKRESNFPVGTESTQTRLNVTNYN